MPNKTILITAGPTLEAIDPVRYLSNHSSGKMGYALAEAAKRGGHSVILISGPTALTPPKGVRFIPVFSARDMYRQVMRYYKKADVIIKVAAVADYRPANITPFKIKKEGRKPPSIKLVLNPDILKILGKRIRKNQVLVGFAAETNRLHHYARKKLVEKNCDFIVMNNVGKKGIGFSSDSNEVTLFARQGATKIFPKMTKAKLAVKILQEVLPKK